MVAFAIAALPARGQIYTYELLPGSTVTPMTNASVSGPTEQLTGEFQIQAYATNTTFSYVAFKYTSLHFASSSYSFSLLGDPQADLSVGIGDSLADPAVDVSASGLSIGSGMIEYYPDQGSYVGPYYRPTELNFPTLRIAPIGGGLWSGEFTINAVLVPEPSTKALVSLALLVFFFRRRAKQDNTGRPAVA